MLLQTKTDIGKFRERNEDCVSIVSNESNEKLLIVADGMGGHKNGEVASSIALNLICDRFKATSSIGNKQDAINWIQSTVSEANMEIFKYVSSIRIASNLLFNKLFNKLDVSVYSFLFVLIILSILFIDLVVSLLSVL